LKVNDLIRLLESLPEEFGESEVWCSVRGVAVKPRAVIVAPHGPGDENEPNVVLADEIT
jgi:hypothetical protein